MTKSIIISTESAKWTDGYLLKLAPMFPELTFQAAYSLEDSMKLAPEAHVFIGEP